jgi:hypothetical protein
MKGFVGGRFKKNANQKLQHPDTHPDVKSSRGGIGSKVLQILSPAGFMPRIQLGPTAAFSCALQPSMAFEWPPSGRPLLRPFSSLRKFTLRILLRALRVPVAPAWSPHITSMLLGASPVLRIGGLRIEFRRKSLFNDLIFLSVSPTSF